MSVNEKLDAEESGGYGSIAPEPKNDAVAYVKRHTIALGVLCVLAFGAAVKVDDDLLKGRDKNGVPLDAAAAALPPTPPASAFSCKDSPCPQPKGAGWAPAKIGPVGPVASVRILSHGQYNHEYICKNGGFDPIVNRHAAERPSPPLS